MNAERDIALLGDNVAVEVAGSGKADATWRTTESRRVVQVDRFLRRGALDHS
jgi:hypothetical protein